MKPKSLIIIAMCTGCSILSMLVLYALSHEGEQQRNSFERRFASSYVVARKNISNLGVNSYYIAGITTDSIYLGNTTTPFYLLNINMSLDGKHQAQINLKNEQIAKYFRIITKVDSPYFYLMDGVVPFVYKGKIDNWQAERCPNAKEFFIDATPIDSSTIALRATVNNEIVLATKSLNSTSITINDTILQKQLDGIFCKDGMLHYDKTSEKIVYLYYYRNQYVVTGKKLNLLARFNTIDTFSRARIKVTTLASDNSVVPAAPLYTTNQASCIAENLLFVNSNLLAKNEPQKISNQGAVIDVYDLENGEYQLSFYLKGHRPVKINIKNMRVYNNVLVAMYDTYIATYDLKNIMNEIQIRKSKRQEIFSGKIRNES